MTDSGIPIRKQTARLLGVKMSQGQGTLLLYPDQLAHVHSPAIRWASTVGCVVVAVPSFALPPHTGPGALGALIGAGGGSKIGGALAKGKAAKEVAAAGGNVTVIQLDSITSLQTSKSKRISGWLGGRSLLVTTADGAAYGFSVNLDKWSADLTSALTARGREVHPTPQGMTVTLAPSGDSRPLS
jgi:hypothetical protein